MKLKYAIAACLIMFFGCEKTERYPDIGLGNGTEKPKPEKPSDKDPEPPVEETGIKPFTPADVKDGGVAYIWDTNVIPEITIKVTKDEWNSFLKRYDEYSNNADFFHCDVTYKKGIEVSTITDAGFRMRGNTSRRRPEGGHGQMLSLIHI